MARREQESWDRSARALAEFQSMSASQFEAAWRIDLQADQQPARVLVERLAAEMGLRIANSADHAAALDAPVTLQLRGVSRLQALESICSQVGLYPDYRRPFEVATGGIFAGMAQALGVLAGQSAKPVEPVKPEEPVVEEFSLPAMTLRSGTRPIPLAFAGPFALEVVELLEFPPDGTGELNLCFFAGGVPAALSTYWSGTHRMAFFAQGIPLSLGDWRETGGRDVLVRERVQWTGSTSAVLPGLTTQLELWHLLRDVETIRIATELGVSLPTKLELIRFDDLATLPVTHGSEFQITLEKMQVRAPVPGNDDGRTDTSRCDIDMTLVGGAETRVDFIALDADGHALHGDSGAYAHLVSTASGTSRIQRRTCRHRRKCQVAFVGVGFRRRYWPWSF